VSYVIEEVAGRRYRFLADRDDREWVTVYGGDLPMAIDVRMEQAPGGRQVFTGLRVGVSERGEVTSQVLRCIRLADILADYFEAFMDDEDVLLASLAHASRPIPPGRGPDGGALQAFAATYKTELARQPHRAMSAAARAHNISRATANRWAAICRERGYLRDTSGEETTS
jgi:hypothetical protein